MEKKIKEILNFWFKECEAKDWFKKNNDFDDEIKIRFFSLIECALKDELINWKHSKEGSLALIILLDQFTRNIYRGQKASFSGDSRALVLSLNCIKKNYLNISSPEWCQFMLIPMMHSEDLNIQARSLPLFEKYTSEKTYNFAVKHHEIISGFGRFPHRNIILGRKSTLEEIEFLKQPNSSF